MWFFEGVKHTNLKSQPSQNVCTVISCFILLIDHSKSTYSVPTSPCPKTMKESECYHVKIDLPVFILRVTQFLRKIELVLCRHH